METMQYLAIGMVAGVCSGIFGVGGGLIIVPALVFVAKFPMHDAIGTSLTALLLPVGIFGVMEYHRSHHIDFRAGLLIAAGLFVSTWFGAKLVQPIPPLVLRRLYGVFLAAAAVRMIVGR